MPDIEQERLERIVRRLQEPVRIDPALDARVMAAVEALPRHGAAGGARRLWDWLTRGRTVSVSPLGGLAAAAAVVLLLFLAVARGPRQASPGPVTASASMDAAGMDTTVIRFLLVAPAASSVSLVGDFNDWNLGATPLRAPRGDGVWSIVVPLPPGRYRYSFVVDGARWVRDPSAPPALEDDFGRPNSVVTVGG